MLNYNNIFQSHIEQIKQEGRYRDFVNITRIAGDFPHAFDNNTKQKIVVWCINDYLGMAQNTQVKQAMIEAVYKMGTGSGGTRNIGGNHNIILELEKEIADLNQKDDAIIFTSGYIANDTSLSTIAKILPNLVFFSDADNHASIIAGIRNSGAEKKIFKHNDIEHLEELLKDTDIDRPKVICFESIYSMDGTESPIAEICELAKKYNALTYLDEVHTVGIYGEGGAGYANAKQQQHNIDFIQGTLGKAYGVIGGYLSASEAMIKAIRATAPGFIFTTSLSPGISAAALASIRHLRNSDFEREKLMQNVAYIKSKLNKLGIKFIENNSHIIPIIVGDPHLTRMISKTLLEEYKIFVQHINYPTVPKGTERLRITPTPCHTKEMADILVEALNEIFTKLNLLQKAA